MSDEIISMNWLDNYLTVSNETEEEKEISTISKILKKLKIKAEIQLQKHDDYFCEDLITKIKAMVHKYILSDKQNENITIKKLIIFIYEIFSLLDGKLFLNKNFLISFLYKRIFECHGFIQMNHIPAILNLESIHYFNQNFEIIINHITMIIANQFLFFENNAENTVRDLLGFLVKNFSDSALCLVKNKFQEYYLYQLICLNVYQTQEISKSLGTEKEMKDFINNKFNYFIKYNNNEDDVINKDKIFFLFHNEFNKQENFMECLDNTITNIFDPTDSNIYSYFNSVYKKGFDHELNLNILENLFAEFTIQDIDIKLRNISYLIDIYLAKYQFIQEMDEINIMIYPRLAIIIGRLLSRVLKYKNDCNKNELINQSYELFIISEFICNYIKYQIKDPEHYPLEIRYFALVSYISSFEEIFITNPLNSFIISITMREIIKYFKFEKQFEIQNKMSSKVKSQKEFSPNKAYRRRSKSKSKKKKKKSVKSRRKTKEVQFLQEIVENVEKNLMGENNESKNCEPNNVLSKVLFNYVSLIFSFQTIYEKNSLDFISLLRFIDDYLSSNININLYNSNWSWILIAKTNIIKNFCLKKTFDKYELKNEKITGCEITQLITYLSKKIKYCNTQEHYFILFILNQIIANLENIENFQNQAYFYNNKTLKRGLSYLLYNGDFNLKLRHSMSYIPQELVAKLLFKITNRITIDSFDEYIWVPKNLTQYYNFEDFIKLIEKSFEKKLNKQSFYSEYLIRNIFELRKYLKIIGDSKNGKFDEKKQYLLCLEYFCKLKLLKERTVEVIRHDNYIKNSIYRLIDAFPNSDYNQNTEKFNILNELLSSGEYDFKICLFLIIQIIKTTDIKVDIDSPENNEIISAVIDLLNNLNTDRGSNPVQYKRGMNFILSLFKSIDKYLYNIANEKYSSNSIKKSKDIKNSNNEKTKDIKIIKKNWLIIQGALFQKGTLYEILFNAEKMNYPKTVMNIIEKIIYDISIINNIHNIFDEKLLLNYIKLYYEAYSHAEYKNKYILDNSFTDQRMYLKLKQINIDFNDNINDNNANNNSSNKYIKFLEEFFKNLNYKKFTKFYQNYQINEDDENDYSSKIISKNSKNLDSKILLLIYYLIEIKSNIDKEKAKTLLEQLIIIHDEIVINLIVSNLKFTGYYESKNVSLLLYEITIFIDLIKIYIYQSSDEDKKLKKIQLAKKLNDKLLIKRNIPHLKEFLPVYNFRRLIFNLYGDEMDELKCLLDICEIFNEKFEIQNKTKDANEYKLFEDYLRIYSSLLISNAEKITEKKYFSKPLKYYMKFFNDETAFNNIYNKYINLTETTNKNLKNYKIIILKDKFQLKNGYCMDTNDIIKKINNLSEKDKEKYVVYADLYCDLLIQNNDVLNITRDRNKFYNISFDDFDYNFLYLILISINICKFCNNEKYLRKYMPELINIFFKFNIASMNSNNNKNNNKKPNYDNKHDSDKEKIDNNKMDYCLRKFIESIEIQKITLIIPQLMVCYQYNDTRLYNFAIYLLSEYANKFIDLIAFMLASSLIFDEEDKDKLKFRRSMDENRIKNSLDMMNKSKIFTKKIKEKLEPRNQKILDGYVGFCQKINNLFVKVKNSSRRNTDKKKPIDYTQEINEINKILENHKIILPTLKNFKNYNPSSRINNDQINDDTLYLKKIYNKVTVLQSKESPIKIKFSTCLINGDDSNNDFDFMVKCDINDITKEIKTFEIINEINNIFKIKHYDENYKMTLKRYMITPIAPTIILAEWLSNSDSLNSIYSLCGEKVGIFNDDIDYFTTVCVDSNKKKKNVVKKNSIVNESEKYNILYEYYQEKYIDPNEWYYAKTNYIISTAIWSMVCFLVGLGDRHNGNIMLNKTNGEIIHIDFGYVALKGLSLPVKELVEFRLTKNLRLNLGLFKENGLFNDICAKCLLMFKEYYRSLNARIEYYMFDPLFDEQADGKTFELFQKNDKFFEDLSVERVFEKLNELILKCTNSENLEKMYYGWIPWM